MNNTHALPGTDAIRGNVRAALAEDVGSGDVTADLVDPEQHSSARIISREEAVLCGTAWFNEAFCQLDGQVRISWLKQDGDPVSRDEVICTLEGPSRVLLSGERTALNFLQTLSGTASTARQWAEAVRGLNTRILDTRKTVPGLRLAQKYAVACGGCFNHRTGLYDAILIKENHIAASGSITTAIDRARELHPQLPLEVEVEDLQQLQEAREPAVSCSTISISPCWPRLSGSRQTQQNSRHRATSRWTMFAAMPKPALTSFQPGR